MGLIDRTEKREAFVAEKHRREPLYPTGDDYDEEVVLPTAEGEHKHGGEDIDPYTYPPALLRRVPVAIETRKLVIVEYGQQALQVTLDGTGSGQVDFGIIAPNQWWIIDNIIAAVPAGGAAGNVYLYERGAVGQVNVMDLVFAKVLLGPQFAVSDYPNTVVLRPGAHVVGGFGACGNGALATYKLMYRVAVMTPGQQEIER
jgi:hypothetical protein